MLTRRFLGAIVAAAAFAAASGTAHAAERQLLGVVLGRSYRQVLAKFGTPSRVQVVQIPVPGQGNAGAADVNAPGAGGVPGYPTPGDYGAPGMMGGGPPSGSGGPPGGSGGPAGYAMPPGGGSGPTYGPPGGSAGPAGYPMPGGSGGGPPVLPPIGGAPGAPGTSELPGGTGGMPVTGVGNGAEWIYTRPGGVTMAFIINEDGRVAQISVSSGKSFPAARTARGVSIGNDYKTVLFKYGWPQQELMGGYYVESYYTKSQHASFTFVKGKLVRITIALAD